MRRYDQNESSDGGSPGAPAGVLWPGSGQTQRGGQQAGAAVLLGGLPTVRASRQDLAETMVRDCLAARHVPRPPRIVFSSNGQGIALAGLDGGFHDMMLMADIIHADGMSVVFASKWLTPTPLPERIATTDFFHDAARAAEREHLRFFMLGAEEGVSRLAYDNARRRYPRIKWVGRLNGYSGLSDEDICAMIRERRPDVVWVALGKPHQEEFCIRNRQLLVGVGWLKTCGGLFDFLADRRVRAPGWMQQAGLEWLFRAAQEPRRLGMRYLTTNLQAIWFLARRSGMEGGP